MTTAPHHPGLLVGIEERTARIGQPVLGVQHIDFAAAVNRALLDNPAGRFNADLIDADTTVSFSYVRNPGARYVHLEARINGFYPPTLATTATPIVGIDLTIRDAAGHSVSSSDTRIPYGFKGELHEAAPARAPEYVTSDQTIVRGVLDADALESTLTDPSWSFDFTLGFSNNGELNTLQLWEAPRFVVNDAVDHGGVVPTAFQRDAMLDDDNQTGLGRLVETLVSARQSERTYVALAFPRQVASPSLTPNVGATSFTQFAALAADSAPQTWRPSPRQVYAGASAGEALRFRFLYRFSGGAGSETAQVQLTGNASGGSWLSPTLAYTTSWTWSSWITAAIRTSPLSDALALKGKVSATGPLIWIASIHVLEAVS